MILEWIVIVGLAVAMYILIYKYEKRIESINKIAKENREKLEEHEKRIDKNREKIDSNYNVIKEHKNHIEKMWITIPKKEDNED